MLNSKANNGLKSWIKTIFIALGITLVIRTFLFSPYVVDGASMEPTLHDHEKIFVNKVYYSDHFNRGDIIIIKGPDENYVKRIIGMPGDEIEMKGDQLFINQVPYKETYLAENLKFAKQQGSKLTEDFGPIVLPKNQYYVMGDNRLYSKDSRNGLGFIKQENIIGKSEFVLLPFSKIRILK
ncbi:signal peptidase I [Neobacillus vireti]|uniref:Signal peptidase I n=1 Tax=Neobacillus vireti LMG 21834 TaxID=1131730 RepID=A0AB94IUK7_9BACI|nr:signal peptidase I [Neobacillus vireti]ETI70789.1 signal peptidase I [Neobacillus vireti LMG 21834]KLT17671.1 signal peptidase [Neobacillus vireti]